MMPSGKVYPADDRRTLREGVSFRDAQFDDVFTGCQFVDGVCTAKIRDPGAERTVSITFGDVFRECVVYTPPHREAICIEPYTCVPDAFRMRAEGIETGLRVLQPGESFEAWMAIELE